MDAAAAAAVAPGPGAPFWRLLGSSWPPVARVLLLCAVGAALATPRVGVLTADARKLLNKLVFIVFLPSLVFFNLGSAVTLQKVLDWWYMPLNVLICCLVGSALGWLVTFICATPRQHRSLTIACCCIGNVGNLPLVLVATVCSEAKNPFAPPAECHKQGIAYVSYGMWVIGTMADTKEFLRRTKEEFIKAYLHTCLQMAVVVMWTFVYNLLKPSECNLSLPDTVQQLKLTKNNFERTLENVKVAEEVGVVTSGAVSASYNEEAGPLHLPLQTVKALGAEEDQALLPANAKSSLLIPHFELEQERRRHTFNHDYTVSLIQGLLTYYSWISRYCRWRDIFTPPTCAAQLLALLVGVIPSLKSVFFGQAAQLSLLTDTLNVLGMAMIPSMMLVLGGNLTKGPGDSDLGWRTVVGITITRLVVLPIVGIGIVFLVDRLGMLPLNDPLFHFVLLLQFAMPTAINVGTVTVLHGTGEKEASIILFWQYSSAVLSMTVWIMVFFSILSS
eukprot:SM000103S09500  [mRNA]  locus=s103:354447:357734:- [translate_table: standard]